MGKTIIRLTESDLHNIIKESVSKILNEGLTPVFKNIAKKHGGVKWLDKNYQFDKLEFPHYGWDTFMTIKKVSDIPYNLLRFINRVMSFNDGTYLYVLKPQYHNDQKIKDMLQASKELSAERSKDYQPGHEWEEVEVDYGAGPFMKSFKTELSPEQMRQKAHKKARGKKQK